MSSMGKRVGLWIDYVVWGGEFLLLCGSVCVVSDSRFSFDPKSLLDFVKHVDDLGCFCSR